MKGILIFFEYLAGVVILIVTFVCMLVGGLIGLCELPRYMRNHAK
jgi:hypothetical protein